MGIREQGYRHWGGTYTGHAFRWWTVAKAAVRATVYSKGRLTTLLILIFVVWAPYLFYALFWFFFAGNEFGEAAQRILGRPDVRLRHDLYYLVNPWEAMVAPLFVAVVAAPLVSNDLRSNALYIYLAKPMRRIDYVLGKMAAIGIWTVPVTLLPTLFVWLSAISSGDKNVKLTEPGKILAELLVVQVVILVVLALAALCLSSLTKRWQVAMMAFLGGYFSLWIVSSIIQEATGQARWLFLSLPTNLINFAKRLFERQTDATPAWQGSLWILLGVAGVALTIFLRKLLKLEVAE